MSGRQIREIMPSRTLATLALIAAGVLAPAAVADAAAKRVSAYPTIKKITPMTVSIGETMTITGTGFLKGKAKNTVAFRRVGKRTIFARANGLSTTRLTVVVPEKLRSSLASVSGTAVSTRFQIRILARRFGKTYTRLGSSPTVLAPASNGSATSPTTAGTPAIASTPTTAGATTAAGPAPAPAPAPKSDPPPPPPPPNCDGDAEIDSVDADDDNDLLPDSLEATLTTNRCLADSDGDGMQDGWEYKSAIDLNRESCPAAEYPVPCEPALPYPGKRPYPNPLDSTDASVDHDGDWLPGGLEHAAWARKTPRTLGDMWYSEGLQASVDSDPADGCRGLTVPDPFDDAAFSGTQYAIYSLDRFGRKGGDGCLMDAERDEDGDFLTNEEETSGELSGGDWWTAVYEKEKPYRVVYRGTNWLDADTDGDGVVDGKDDQDFDDFWNVEEVVRGGGPDGLWVQPFNPCLPAINSRTCPGVIPTSGEPWAPFYKDEAVDPSWPLYQQTFGPYALWAPLFAITQDLPPQHPLPR